MVSLQKRTSLQNQTDEHHQSRACPGKPGRGIGYADEEMHDGRTRFLKQKYRRFQHPFTQQKCRRCGERQTKNDPEKLLAQGVFSFGYGQTVGSFTFPARQSQYPASSFSHKNATDQNQQIHSESAAQKVNKPAAARHIHHQPHRSRQSGKIEK